MVLYLGPVWPANPMDSAPDTTLGPHVFGANYFSKKDDNPHRHA
jgi:hypothetical protein